MMYRISAVVFLSMSLFVMRGIASAHEGLCSLWKDREGQYQNTSSAPSTFVFCSFPLQSVQVELKPNATLVESTRVLDTTALRLGEYQITSAGSPTTGYIRKNLYFAGSQLSDTVMWMRGNQAVVFPRILLHSTQVATAQLRNGDFVAAFLARGETVSDDSDAVRAWYRKSVFDRAPKKGDGSSENVIWEAEGNVRASQILNVAELIQKMDETRPGTGDVYLVDLTEISRAVISASISERMVLPVVVSVTRKVGNYSVTLVVPYKYAGQFGIDGAAFRRTFGSNSADFSTVWDIVFSPHVGIRLLPGDTVEFKVLDGTFPGFL